MAAALRIALGLITLGGVLLFIVHPLWFPAAASAQAALVDHNFYRAFWILGALFVAGQAVLAFALMRGAPVRHASPELQQRSRHWYGNGRLEIGWTLAITAIFFWFHVSGGQLWSSMAFPEKAAGQIHIEVTGAQFQWHFHYPGPDGVFGRIDAAKFAKPDEGNPLGLDPADPAARDDIVSSVMAVPVGRLVELRLHAPDVVHSLFIPAMRLKQDAVPGMETHAHFQPAGIGTYEIACAELCGLGHYRMRALVRVMSEEEFKKWLSAQSPAFPQE
jgi:cytochrome c oxidase subunit 2